MVDHLLRNKAQVARGEALAASEKEKTRKDRGAKGPAEES